MSVVLAAVVIVFNVVVIIFYVLSGWTVFSKAGRPGWAALIPLYNLYVVLKIVGRPGWWLVLSFIPLVNVVISLIVSLDLAKSFGRGTAFGLGIWLLPFIFLPILAFGAASYVGPAAGGGLS